MPVTLDAFLRAWRFLGHPFATTNAGQEREQLAAYFVRVSWFDRLVGTPQHPESLILFAPTGYGKTSHRLEVARRANERRDAPALVVTFTDFELLMPEVSAAASISAYLPLIRQATLEALDDALHDAAERERSLRANQAAYARFCALLTLFAPLRMLGREPPPGLTDDMLTAFRDAQLSVKAWLNELSGLARAAGYASVYVLIDGVDELEETRDDDEMALQLLRPLLDAPWALQECGFAFKFFLPEALKSLMEQQRIGRLDRIRAYTLTWSNDDLRAMLSKRLIRYSLIGGARHNGHVTAFRDLCEPDVDADAYLVQAAQGSPRRLLDQARHIIEAHCRSIDDPLTPVYLETIQRVLSQPMPHHSTGLTTRPQPEPVDAPTQSDAAPPLLFFDEWGDIWVGSQRRTRKPLPKYLRKCMDYLWCHRYQTVAYEQLMEALYGATLDIRENPRSSCDKIVRRLRSVLEPGQESSPTYIEVQPGVGYALRNFRDEPGSGQEHVHEISNESQQNI
jgi:hypothetical protein